jgi:WhiB family redox-sensing transcriptional regulator
MDKRPTAKIAPGRRGRTAPAPVPITNWISNAACAAADPEAFFPASPESDAKAKQYCASCPVRAECRDYALAAGVECGVWGGLNENERKAIRQEAAQQEPAANAIGGAA